MADNIKTRILVVDDDKTLLDMYKERLCLGGYEVYTASDGEQALSRAVEIMPNAILLDVMMPKVNGFDVLNILKNTPETKDIPVIILTALSQGNHRQKGLTDGADDFIVKSEVMPKEVVAKIDGVVKKRKSQLNKKAK